MYVVELAASFYVTAACYMFPMSNNLDCTMSDILVNVLGLLSRRGRDENSRPWAMEG